jgi:enoyl-CoA hydratase
VEVSFEINAGIAQIAMDDGKKNAITPAAAEHILSAIEEAEATADAIVLAGRPGAFCAGFDLATMTSGDTQAIDTLGQAGARILLKLYSTGKPLVAACTGHAFTIGALWLLASDTRIGEEGAYKFGMTETAMGMVLPDWALEPLKARLGTTHFLPVVTQSVTLNPAGAVAAGFLDRLVPEGRALEAALDTAAQLAKLPPSAYAGNKLVPRKQALEIMSASLSD